MPINTHEKVEIDRRLSLELDQGTSTWSLKLDGTSIMSGTTAALNLLLPATFDNAELKVKDTGGDHTIAIVPSSDEAANRTLSIPALGGNDTIMTLGTAQTVTGVKTMSGANVLSAASLKGVAASHLVLDTIADDKQVRINARNFTQATGDSVAAQFTPNQTVSTTGEVFGAQFKPRAAADVNVAGVNGIGIDSELKAGTGNASADLRGINAYLGATGSGTISGDVVGIRLRHEVAATVTGDSVAMDIDDNEGATDWTHFLKLGAALGTHGMTTNSDKTGGAKSGTIKVKIGGTLYHLQCYAD